MKEKNQFQMIVCANNMSHAKRYTALEASRIIQQTADDEQSSSCEHDTYNHIYNWHKFLEAGHTFIEVDSIHSTIERTVRHRELYSPSDIDTYIAIAKKRGNKYKTVRLTYGDMIDLKHEATCRFNCTAFVGISKMHHIVYTRGADGVDVWWKQTVGNFQGTFTICL